MFPLKLASILLIACAGLLGQVENTAIYGIGMRITGDQLLVKDVLHATATGLDESPTIGFNYAIPEPITYIEILSQENVQAEVNFSYQNDLVAGNVVAIETNSTEEEEMTLATAAKPFEVLITIYGFNDTMLNVNPAHILNRDQQFRGMLLPLDDEDDFEEEYVNESADGLEIFEDDVDDDHDADGDGIADEDDEDFGADADADDINGDFDSTDKIIEVGRRQPGDYLLYETYQTSAITTAEHTNHSVIFYYIDSNFITYAKFIVFDRNADVLSTDYMPPVAEYSHFSPKTLKATVTDFNTTNLFVQMLLYGYGPKDLPNTYQPFLHSDSMLDLSDDDDDADANTEDPEMSPMHRLRMMLNSKAREAAMSAGEALQEATSAGHADSNVCREGEDCGAGAGDGCVATGSMSVGLSVLIALLAGIVGNAMFVVRRQI